jgi:hypothetical protein
MKEGSKTGHLSVEDSMKKTMKVDSFTGHYERYVEQGSEMGVCFHGGTAYGDHGGALLS